uniref:hypothetical protein n=1 Tax=Actinoplanes sandaracinus TaxID=3045177 RepID=UPI0038995E62
MAEQLGRAPSTISREINRNSDPETRDYHPFAAHQRAAARRPRPKPAKRRTNAECATWSKSCWISGGAQSRSAGPCRCSILTGRSCG